MEGVQVSAPVPARAGWGSLPARALAWARGFFPKSRHGWAVAGGVASAPTITIGALAYLVFSRPLLTTGNLSSYLLWKGTELMQTLVAAVTNLATGSAILVRVFAFFEPVTESPMLLGLGGVGLSLVSAGALWVLYRNLIVPSADDRYARARV